ncbi:MAG: carbohydrate kinase [Pseudomonadota bacterium]
MILCCGEALIDMIPTPTAEGRNGFVPHSGGAVFNTAIALGRLGRRAGMLTGLSEDFFGQQLRAALMASHVDISLAITTSRPTTLAFVKLVEGHASYSFFDENSAGRMLVPGDMPPLPPDVCALFFGGISLACEPCADAYAALLAREGDGRAIMLDPNIRPDFISDPARYRDRLKTMLAAADIVKVSDEDLNWIVPEPLPLTEKARLLLSRGSALVVITKGGDGASGFHANGISVDVSAQAAEIVDTVGAGDTFNAGLLARLSEEGTLTKGGIRDLSADTLEDALRHGARVAAITVGRAGPNPPWAAEL